MGKTAREIISPDIVQDLIRAHCDEWLAYYLYNFMSKTISGNLYPQLQSMLEALAKDEYEHANELADMIVTLGGQPIADFTALEENANFASIVPPVDLTIDSIKTVVAESEANAINTYNELALKTKDTDIPVYELIAHILSEEVKHEESFENL